MSDNELYALAHVNADDPPATRYVELLDLPSQLTDDEYLSLYNNHIDELPLPTLNDCPANRIRIARHALTSACELLAERVWSVAV